jgi:hypothetical protein
MALKVEDAVDGGMHAEEALGGSSRFEPLHFALSPSHRLMRVFGAIISPQPLLVWASQSQTPERGGVRGSRTRTNFVDLAKQEMPEKLVLCTTGSRFTFTA